VARRTHARRYSQAIFEIALEEKALDRWQSDLSNIVSTIGDAEVLALLESPRLPFEGKTKILAERLGDVNPKALNLVHLLLFKGRLCIIVNIADEYQRLLDSHHGIEPAEVITAVPLDDKDVQKLTENLSALVGKKVVLKSEVDSSVIGGIVARVGGKLLDGSTRSKLAALRRELVGTGRKR